MLIKLEVKIIENEINIVLDTKVWIYWNFNKKIIKDITPAEIRKV